MTGELDIAADAPVVKEVFVFDKAEDGKGQAKGANGVPDTNEFDVSAFGYRILAFPRH